MNARIAELLEEIRQREEELETLVRNQQTLFFYKLEDGKIRFEETIREAQRKLKVGSLRWLWESNPRNVLSAPVIYAMIIPFVFLDLCLTVYQWLCFPLYKIARVKRGDYIAIDRYHLSYLNAIEKINCTYCGYINGLIAYSREIVARTEQYWCPIKHAHKVLGSHDRYAKFAEFGDAEAYREAMGRRNA